MPSIIYYYPIDLTGRSSTNRTTRESHLLVNHAGTPYRVFSLTHGGFYTRDLIVRDSNNQELRPFQDYIATFTYEDASFRTGLEVCGAIVVINPAITGIVYVDAFMVGGDYAFNMEASEMVIQHLVDNPGEVPVWAGIVGVPTEYGPGELENELWEKVGYQHVNISLDTLSQAIQSGDQERLAQYRVDAVDEYNQFLSEFGTLLADHEADLDNPHATTKAQVGLGSVQNYTVSTEVQARAGTDNGSYMTPLRVAQAIDQFADQPLTAHRNRVDNPHQVTAAQLGTMTYAATDNAMAGKLALNGTAANAAGITDSLTDATLRSYIQAYNDIRTGIPAANITTGVLNPSRLGTGVVGGGKALASNGAWTPLSTLIAQYGGSSGTPVYFVDYFGAAGAAMESWLNSTFTDPVAYPVGSIILFRYTETFPNPYGSRGRGPTLYQRIMMPAIKQASGWKVNP